MAPAQIDHVVILLPYKDLESPPSWLTDNFTITPGGRHNDGRTENKLIVFQDGTYLELIAFVNDSAFHRRGHPWGAKHYGFVDFALTSPKEFDYTGLRGRINKHSGRLAIDYAFPTEGGRKRAEDGKEVKWKVTVPVNQSTAKPPPWSPPPNRRGEIPFWCHDVTERKLRVDMEGTTHPSGALGIAQLTVLAPKAKVEGYIELYSSIMDTQPVRVFGTTRLPLDTPVVVPGLVKPWVFVEEPTLEAEKQMITERGPGIVEVALRVGTDGRVGLARAPINMEGIWIHFLM